MITVPLLRHQRYISPFPLTSRVKSNDKTYQEKNVYFDTFDGHVMVNYIILMIDNDQSATIEAPEVYKSIPTHSPSRNQRQNVLVLEKNVDFDTFDGQVMVNFIEPNFQDIIFTLSTVS